MPPEMHSRRLLSRDESGGARARTATPIVRRARGGAAPRPARAPDTLDRLSDSLDGLLAITVNPAVATPLGSGAARSSGQGVRKGTFDLLLAPHCSTAQIAIFENHVGALVRRRQHTRAAVDRRRKGDDDKEEFAGDFHLLCAADSESLSSEERLTALWGEESEPGKHVSEGLVSRLSSFELEGVLQDMLMPRERLIFHFSDSHDSDSAGSRPAELKVNARAAESSTGVTVDRVLDLEQPSVASASSSCENGELFSRDELERLVATMLLERHTAAIQIQRAQRRSLVLTFASQHGVIIRAHGSAGILAAAHHAQVLPHAGAPSRATLLFNGDQAGRSRGQQGTGTESISVLWSAMLLAGITAVEVERQCRAQRLRGWLLRSAAQRAGDISMEHGDKMECLDLLQVAQDGDTVTIPAGRHYRRLTALSASVSATQGYLCVDDAKDVRVGGVVSVGGEEMAVLAKTRTRVMVRRRVPLFFRLPPPASRLPPPALRLVRCPTSLGCDSLLRGRSATRGTAAAARFA